MIVEPLSPVFTVDASTCKTSGGADWYPRRDIERQLVHWFYGPRLVRGDGRAAPWCSASTRDQRPLLATVPNTRLSVDLSGGTPCPECNAKWSMT